MVADMTAKTEHALRSVRPGRWRTPAIAVMTALLLAALLANPAIATEKRLIFAHAMMTQPVYGRSVDGFKREIADARAMGIDGFVIELFGYETHRASRDAARMMFEAAETSDPGFKLFVMLGVPGRKSGNWTPYDMVLAVRAFANKPNYFRIDGRPVVATWRGEQMSADWWRTNVLAPLKAVGLPVHFMPYLPNKPVKRVIEEFGPIMDATYNFAVSGPERGIEKSRRWSRLFKQRDIPFVHAFGPSYWQVCSDKKGQARYFEHHGGEGFARHWAYVIDELKPKIVIYAVWNDFGESNFMAPADQPPPFFRNTNVPTWTHRGFAEMSKYYNEWFKTGTPPPIEQDKLFFFYRQHPKDLPSFATDQCAVWNKRVELNGDVSDTLYVTTMLTAPAQLRVVSGEQESVREVPAGIHHTRVPAMLGVPVFELSRGGQVLIRKPGTLEITDTPRTRNFHVYADFAVAGTVEPEARADAGKQSGKEQDR